MTKKEKMRELREKGMLYREIAKECGVSHQYVAFVLGKSGPNGGFRPYKEDGCIYEGLRAWLNEKHVTRRELCRILQKEASHGGSAAAVRDHLRGEGSFSVSDINHIIEASGMTYEALFMNDKQATENEQEKTSGWISVEEQLPETYVPVLAFDRFGHIHDRYMYNCNDGTPLFTAEYLTTSKDVTHWMPLPEPPDVEEY